MLTIFYSNKLEALAAQLCALMQAQPLEGLQAETILIESSAMGHYLKQSITQQLGIAANIQLPYPAAFIWQIYRMLNPDLAKQSSFDRGPLSLRLWAIFNQHGEQCDIAPELAAYLQQLTNSKQRLLFAQHLADLFDQYQIYRPEYLQQWQRGDFRSAADLAWQGQLWQLLHAPADSSNDRSVIFYNSLQALEKKGASIAALYSRLHIFSLSSLPRSYLSIIEKLAQHIEINIFVLNPCQHFWLDAKAEKNAFDDAVDENQNELLLLLARQNRGFIQQLVDLPDSRLEQCYIETRQENLLHYLQDDICQFRQSSVENKRSLQADDRSVEVHCCHHPMREVQVLHDQLLDRLEKNPDIALDEICVLVPDVDNYAPYIHAVFSAADTSLRLPYSISEKNDFQKKPLIRVLLQLLAMPSTQFKRCDIIAVLEEPFIADFFAIDDMGLVKNILQELNVRFALEDSVWQNYGEQVVSLSFQQARKRLLKSYAFHSSAADESIIAGIQDGNAENCGNVLAFIDALGLLNQQAQASPIDIWCDYIERVLQAFFPLDNDDLLYDAQLVLDNLEVLRGDALLAQLSAEISFDCFLHLFEQGLQNSSGQQVFRSGMINIASLLPMRALPFKIVCVLGMNDGEFPRPRNKDQIDLLLKAPMLGDRNRLDEERYLFLQALLSAREYFYVSYVGKSIIDNSEKYPSLLLAELLEFIDKGFSYEGQAASKKIAYEHALQAFDQRYFSAESRLFSYQPSHYQQALALATPRAETAFIQNDMLLDKPDSLLLDFCIRVLNAPSTALLQRLDIVLDEAETEEISVESFASDALDRHRLLEHLFDAAISAKPAGSLAHWVSQGLLPQAAFAELSLQGFSTIADSMSRQYHALHLQCIGPPQNIQYTVGGYSLSMSSKRINASANQQIAVVANKLHGRHFLRAWCQHLLLTVAQGDVKTYLFSSEQCCYFQPLAIDVAKEALQALLAKVMAYQQNISYFFVDAAWQFLLSWQKGDEEKAFAALRKTLYGGHNHRGEMDNAYHQLAYQGQDIPLERVAAEAKEVLGLALDYLRIVELEE